MGRPLLFSARRLVIYTCVCAKFPEIISHGIKVIGRTISIRKITEGNNSAKNIGGVTVVNLCRSSGHILHFYQVL